MAVYSYDSTHSGAPQINTTAAGGLLTVLDACLVGTSGTAYGSTASLGWSTAYSATNQRSYRMPTATSQFYLHADDTGTGAPGFCKLRGYESMTAATAGSNAFPTAVQLATIGIQRGSADITTNYRRWCMVSNGKLFHLVIDYTNNMYNTSYMSQGQIFTFGDFTSLKSGDAYNCMLYGVTSTSVFSFAMANSAFAATAGLYTARDYIGTAAGAINMSRFTHFSLASGTSRNADNLSLAANGSLTFSRLFLGETISSNRVQRGHVPGIWFLVNGVLTLKSFIDGVTTHDGRTLKIVNMFNALYVGLETSDTWD